jgi:general secretion pathway protein J
MIRRREHGFTLLELLIAITLLGMILVLLFAGLRLGVRSWDAAQANVDSMSSVRAVESFLRREIGQTYPYRWKKGLPNRMAFQGEPHKVSFVAPLPSRIGGGGLYAVSIELLQNGNEKRIVWKQLPLSGQMEDFSGLGGVKEMVLATGEVGRVGDVWLDYYGRETEDTEPRWLDNWQNDKLLPMLVRVRVKLADGGEWPDFVVAPAISSDGVR